MLVLITTFQESPLISEVGCLVTEIPPRPWYPSRAGDTRPLHFLTCSRCPMSFHIYLHGVWSKHPRPRMSADSARGLRPVVISEPRPVHRVPLALPHAFPPTCFCPDLLHRALTATPSPRVSGTADLRTHRPPHRSCRAGPQTRRAHRHWDRPPLRSRPHSPAEPLAPPCPSGLPQRLPVSVERQHHAFSFLLRPHTRLSRLSADDLASLTRNPRESNELLGRPPRPSALSVYLSVKVLPHCTCFFSCRW